MRSAAFGEVAVDPDNQGLGRVRPMHARSSVLPMSATYQLGILSNYAHTRDADSIPSV